MGKVDRYVWGCLECGSFVETLTADGLCSSCQEGLVVELGGEPTAEKAQALLAWARRDATQQIQNRGTIVGAGLGLAIGMLGVVLATDLAVGGVLLLLYTAVLGALWGRLLALRGHRLLRPHHRLQPTHNPAQHRRLVVALVFWILAPVAAGTAFAIFGEGQLGVDGRRALGQLWSLLSGD